MLDALQYENDQVSWVCAMQENLFLESFLVVLSDLRIVTDIDECKSDPCIAEAFCTNLYPFYRCTCDIGYAGDGNTCTGVHSQI